MLDFTIFASGSTGNCYRLTDGVTPLLIECGIPANELKAKLWAKNHHLTDIAGCLIGHSHQDHCKAAKDLMSFGIDCYATAGTIEAMRWRGHRLHQLELLTNKPDYYVPFRLGTWTVLPFRTEHDATEPVGFLLRNKEGEQFLYASDTAYIRYRFPPLNMIAIECNYSLDYLKENVANGTVDRAVKHRVIRNHFSLENVKAFLQANDLSQVLEIWLLHLSETNADPAMFKAEVQAVTGKVVLP